MQTLPSLRPPVPIIKTTQTWADVENFFNLSLDMVGIADAAGYFKRLNPSWTATLGWSQDELMARPHFELVHPDDHADTLAALAVAVQLTAGAKVHHFTNRYRCKDGEYRNLEWRTTPVESGNGAYLVARDVTELTKIQDDLREKAALVQISHDAMAVLDPVDTRIRSWNKAAMELYGYSAEEAVGQLAHDLLQTILSVPLEEILTQTRDRGHWDGQLRQRTKSGAEVIVDSRWLAQRDASGATIAILKTNRDITARVIAEEELRTAYDSLEERVRERTADLEAFTYTVSHDLRTPIRAIVGFTDVLVEDSADQLDADALEAVAEIRGGAVRLGKLVDDLLSFSRLGKREIKRQTVDMEALAKQVTKLLAQTAGDGSAEIDVKPMPTCSGDSGLLELVYLNLISNAAKFTAGRPKPRIEVGAEIGSGPTVYYVRDNGVGFDMAYAGQLFGVFQRLHSLSEFDGNGVGLASVKRIINGHGGKVWAEAAPDQGATFFFTLGGGSDA
jgi:PAS domain S-box-containing protein